MKHVFKSYYLDYPLVKGRIFDVFEPEEITKDVAVFWVHGGGWRGGDRVFHTIMEALNERGYLVASTESQAVPSVITSSEHLMGTFFIP